jgi:Zn-dependent protease
MIDIVQIIQLIIILAVSIWLHEYAHAYVSYKLWDPTPKLQWRLTPNPLKHIDPIWFLMIFLIHFGRWKPVQINPMYYKNPRKWELMVALAWPATNLVLAFFAILFLVISSKITWIWLQAIINPSDIFFSFWIHFSFINIALAIFNLLPIPPLDGFRLVKMFSWKLGQFIERYTIYIWIFFLILIIWPGSNIIWWFLTSVSSMIFNIIFMIIGQVFY